MYQTGLTCTKGVANGGRSFPEKNFPTPPREVVGLAVICPETDAPHGVRRAGFSQIFGARDR